MTIFSRSIITPILQVSKPKRLRIMVKGKWQSPNWLQGHLRITEALLKQEDTDKFLLLITVFNVAEFSDGGRADVWILLEKIQGERFGSARKVNFCYCFVSEDLAALYCHDSRVLLWIRVMQRHLILFTAQLVL